MIGRNLQVANDVGDTANAIASDLVRQPNVDNLVGLRLRSGGDISKDAAYKGQVLGEHLGSQALTEGLSVAKSNTMRQVSGVLKFQKEWDVLELFTCPVVELDCLAQGHDGQGDRQGCILLAELRQYQTAVVFAAAVMDLAQRQGEAQLVNRSNSSGVVGDFVFAEGADQGHEAQVGASGDRDLERMLVSGE